MQKARVTVTVRREVLAKAERQVRRGRAKSVSAWVDAAMEEKARREDLAALLSEMKAENGAATDKEEAWARAVLGPQSSTRAHSSRSRETIERSERALCGRSGTRDVVDASVALLARRHHAVVVTSDPDDLGRVDPSLPLVRC